MQRPHHIGGKKARRLDLVGLQERHEREMRGVVDEDVHRAEPVGGLGDDALAVGGRGDVRLDGERRRPGMVGNGGGSMFQPFDVARDDRHARALAGEGARDRKANARAPAGDHRHFSGKASLGHRTKAGALGALALPDRAAARSEATSSARCSQGYGIAWKRFASALIFFAVSMSRSVIFMPASWVQNEKETML